MADSTSTRKRRKARNGRPPKPRKDFPLYPHPAGYWARKINGKLRYFGRWGKVVDGVVERLPGDGWIEAEALYESQRADLYAGRVPASVRIKNGETALKVLCNEFRTAKLRAMEAGAIGGRMYDEYVSVTDFLIQEFGKDTFVAALTAA